jgi:hypothetical protein
MEVLSIQKELILSWTFAGPTSPWVNPVLSGPSGTRTVNGIPYNIYQIEWSVPNEDWTGEKRGAVRAGKGFQVGGTFSSVSKDRRVCGSDNCRGPDAIIVGGLTLFDDEDQALGQHPHWLGFDAATFDDKGNLNLRFFNFLDQPLILRDVVVQDLPRVLSINAMTRNTPELRDVFGRTFKPWNGGIRCPLSQSATQAGTGCPMAQAKIEAGKDHMVTVAKRNQGRHVSVQRTEDDCALQSGPRGGRYCHPGITVDDLFPATTMYVTATVVDHAGRESHLFYQIAGRRTALCLESDPCVRRPLE